MSTKRLVVNNALCVCKFGTAPDKLQVLTNSKEYANDSEGMEKAIATSMDLGATFQAGTFGSCSKKRGSACTSVVTEWSGTYEAIQLSNGGNPLLEDSKATCPIGGKDCITITFHGQTDEMTQQNLDNTQAFVSEALNPAVNIQTPKISKDK